MDFSQFGNSIAQSAVKGGMRTTSTMQRPSDNAANQRARKRRGNKRGSNNGQLSAQDLIALFQSMPTPNRGFRRPGGDQIDSLGGGLDQFYANNPSIARGPDRAGQIAKERQQQLNNGFDAGRAAVDFTKQTKGYTDAQGNFVPPTMPIAPGSNYGTGSVAFTDKPTDGMMPDPLTGNPVRMDEYLPQQSIVQDTKYGVMPGQGGGGALAKQPGLFDAIRSQPRNDMAALFPGQKLKPMRVADTGSSSPVQSATEQQPAGPTAESMGYSFPGEPASYGDLTNSAPDLSWLEGLFKPVANSPAERLGFNFPGEPSSYGDFTSRAPGPNPSMRGPDPAPPLRPDNLQQQPMFQSPQGLSGYFPAAQPAFPQEQPMAGDPNIVAALRQILAPQTTGLMTQLPRKPQQSQMAPVAPPAPVTLDDLWGMQPQPTGMQNHRFPRSYFPQQQRLF